MRSNVFQVIADQTERVIITLTNDINELEKC